MYRNIATSVWNDTKIESLGSSATYLWLYLLTSPAGSICGCYELTPRRMAYDTKLTVEEVTDSISELVAADVICFDSETNEVLIKNWRKYNWTASKSLYKPIVTAIEDVKNADFKASLIRAFEEYYKKSYEEVKGTVLTRCKDRVNTHSVPVPVPVPVTNQEGVQGEDGQNRTNSEEIEAVVFHLNAATGCSYRASSKKTASLVNARLREGFTVEDFRAVIDKKARDWLGDAKMSRYLRPETLFGTKFEGYLQEAKSEEVAHGEFAKYR